MIDYKDFVEMLCIDHELIEAAVQADIIRMHPLDAGVAAHAAFCAAEQ